jgi:hypothetical protein
MEILRVPPYPITATWGVPEANADYVIYIEDLVDHSFENVEITSDNQSQIHYVMPRAKLQFDRDFLFRVYDTLGEIVIDSNLTVYRPYIDPNMLGTTATDIAEYKELEIVARSIIDTYLQEGSGTGGAFYNHKLVIQKTGEGTDYFPIWHNANRVLKVYENDVLVYDFEDTETNWEFTYKVTLDNSSIYRFVTTEPTNTEYNRLEYNPTKTPMAIGDLGFYGRSGRGVAFPKGYDYTFILDAGYKAIPPDVELAAKYLIEDIKCGNNDYWKRFVTQYNTEQFDVKFAPQFLEGTGNLIVDKILSNYKGNLLKPGIF